MEDFAWERWSEIASLHMELLPCFWIGCFIKRMLLITMSVVNAASLRKPSPPKSQLPCIPGCFAEAVACLVLRTSLT